MWVTGFEPAQALSYRILSPAYLTTLAHPHNFSKISLLKKLPKDTPIQKVQFHF